MSKHTPGPWEACEPGAYSDFGGRSSVILGDDMRIAVVQGNREQDVANARLMAAAPELLDALLYYRNEVSGNEPSISVFCQKLDAAIAKATGEQQ